jgi:ribosome-binding factor A
MSPRRNKSAEGCKAGKAVKESMEGKRSDRVADLIHREVSEMLQRSVKDPRVGFVTITRVQVSDDCRQARIYYSVMGSPEEQEASLKGLQSARGFIRKELGHRLQLRYTPDVLFQFDPSIEYSIRLGEIFQKLHDESEGHEENGRDPGRR